jgi:hypothetical protein
VSGDDGIGTTQVFETVGSFVFPPGSSCSASDMISSVAEIVPWMIAEYFRRRDAA